MLRFFVKAATSEPVKQIAKDTARAVFASSVGLASIELGNKAKEMNNQVKSSIVEPSTNYQLPEDLENLKSTLITGFGA